MNENKSLNKLQQVALNSVAYVAKANYQDREDEAKASFDKTFNECYSGQAEPIKEKLNNLYKVVIKAIEHVGSANYDHREKEANRWVNEAFEQL